MAEEFYSLKGNCDEFEDILDFANMVFSMSSDSIDFSACIPKAYAPGYGDNVVHFFIKDDDRIKALIDVYEQKLVLTGYGEQLKTGYIGTVSVHPRSRNKGYMKALMQKVEEQQRQSGTDLLILDGNRHRYQHFGFEKAGMKYCFNITADSIRHTCSKLSEKDYDTEYSFEPVEEENELVECIYSYYLKRNITVRDRQNFLECLKSWQADTYAVIYSDICVGYINVSADERSIYEFELEDINTLPFVIDSFMKEFSLYELGINVGTDETDKINLLEMMSDYFQVSMSHQIKILNYRHVLKFMLMWKQHYTVLNDGVFTIAVQGEGNYTIKIENGEITVSDSNKNPDVECSALELIKIFTTTYYYHELQKNDSIVKNAPAGWFPLPFFLPEADAF